MDVVRAVISSTARDLPEYRSAAIDACVELGVLPTQVVSFSDVDPATARSCRQLVDESEIYIGVIGSQYGAIPDGFEQSITELEYERARMLGIPTLMFIKSDLDSAPLPTDCEEPANQKLMAFKAKVEATSLCVYFSSLKDFDLKFRSALSSYTRDRTSAGWIRGLKRKRHATILKVFVASPQDVQAERERMPRVIQSLNKTYGKMANSVIELWRWEEDAPPCLGEPQALIDPELDEADVVVVIFWNRFGTQSASGTTGTQSEVVRSLRRWKTTGKPQVLVYYCQRPALLDQEGCKQRIAVLDFRDQISEFALLGEYSDTEDFEWRVRDDLFLTFDKVQASR